VVLTDILVKATVRFDDADSLEHTREWAWRIDQLENVTDAQAVQAVKAKVATERLAIQASKTAVQTLLNGLKNRDLDQEGNP
jgi:hypothetical protein